MARNFPETAHLKTDIKKYQDNFDRIDWGKPKATEPEVEKGFPRDEVDRLFQDTEFFTDENITTLETHWALKGFRLGYTLGRLMK